MKITTLYQRRIRGDIIETYKILTGQDNVASDNFFRLYTGSHNTRCHRLKCQFSAVDSIYERTSSVSMSSTFEQFAIGRCQFRHDMQGNIRQVLLEIDMSVKGFPYQARYHQSPIPGLLVGFSVLVLR